MNLLKLREQLKIDEGVRVTPYRDTVGKLTIGCGRNLDDVPLSTDEIELMLSNDIGRALNTCRRIFRDFDVFSDSRQNALINMAFNVGETRLRGFKKMVDAVNTGDWVRAAIEAKDSKWYGQVGDRAKRIIAAFGVA